MTKVGRENCFAKQFEMNVRKGKVDMAFRGKLGLLLLCFATCSEKPVFQQFAYTNFSKNNTASYKDINTYAYCISLNTQINFWCYYITKIN